MSNLLITGAAGLVGTAVASSLLRAGAHLTLMCRGRGNTDARTRMSHAIREQLELDDALEAAELFDSAVEVIDADLADLDFDGQMMSRLANVDTVLHCAADVNLGKDPYGHTYINNCKATKSALELSSRLPRLEAFHFVSTAYVAGTHVGMAMEDTLIETTFNNAYEKSKHHSEAVVRASGLPFTIYRPSIIVGRLSDGKIRKPLAFYRIMEFMGTIKRHRCAKMGVPPSTRISMPFRFETKRSDNIYFTPIDYVQKTIVDLLPRKAEGRTYHLTGRAPVSICDIIDITGEAIGIDGIDVLDHVPTPTIEEKLVRKFVGDLLPYFSSETIFDITNVIDALGPESVSWTIGRSGLMTLIGGYYRSAFPSFRVKP